MKIVWYCPNCRTDRHPIFAGKVTPECIVCYGDMIPTTKIPAISEEDANRLADALEDLSDTQLAAKRGYEGDC